MANSCIHGPSSEYPDVGRVHEALFASRSTDYGANSEEDGMQSGISEGASEQDMLSEVLTSISEAVSI